jgi:hypothetical protein
MIRALANLSGLLLMACSGPGTGDEPAQTAESEARVAAAKQYPGVDLDGLATCVRDNASEEQLVALSLGGKVAEDATAAVLAKPETGQCVRDNNIELPS